jgi:hypothetical protein
MARRLWDPVNVSISFCEHCLVPILKDNNISHRKRINIVDFLLDCIFLVVVYTKIAHYISIQSPEYGFRSQQPVVPLSFVLALSL